MPRAARTRPGGAAPKYPPFHVYAGLHDRELEVALRRYCVTTTGPVVIVLSDPSGATAQDGVVLARVARRLEPFHRAFVIKPRSETDNPAGLAPVPTAARCETAAPGRNATPGVRAPSGPKRSAVAPPYTPVT